MEEVVCRDEEGMTLLEVMIALVLTSVTALALSQSALLAMKTNLRNELRAEAVSVAEQRMSELRSTPFPVSTSNDLSATTGLVTEPTVTRMVRSGVYAFTPDRQVSDVNNNSKQVTVTVQWTYTGVVCQHSVATLLRRP